MFLLQKDEVEVVLSDLGVQVFVESRVGTMSMTIRRSTALGWSSANRCATIDAATGETLDLFDDGTWFALELKDAARLDQMKARAI